MTEFDRLYTTSYWSSCLTLKNVATLKFGVSVMKFIGDGSIRQIVCEFLFLCIYGHILCCFRDKARYWLQIEIFNTTFHIKII